MSYTAQEEESVYGYMNTDVGRLTNIDAPLERLVFFNDRETQTYVGQATNIGT